MAGSADSTSHHDRDTLRVMTGGVVGRYKHDVFVELGERMQGVARLEDFGEPPRIGSRFEFTLRGQEESLWILMLAERPVLASWQTMEVDALVEVRVVRGKVGGLEGKIGRLHAFLPKGQTGLERGQHAEELIGQNIVCQVIEVDAEKQRVVVSRRAVLKGTDTASRAAREGRLLPGMEIDGRVTRVERYGAFLRFGRDLTGLAHRSELSWGFVDDARELFKKGDRVPAVVLTVRQGGKRIGLGVKQLTPNPWKELESEDTVGRSLAGRVRAVREWGAQVEAAGVVGFLPAQEIRASRGPNRPLKRDEEVVVRIVACDSDEERLNLSLRNTLGKTLRQEDLLTVTLPKEEHFGSALGALFNAALSNRDD